MLCLFDYVFCLFTEHTHTTNTHSIHTRTSQIRTLQALQIPNANTGAYSAGLITEEERVDIVRNSCPGPGACGGMYTANTMASAIEALGMSLPYSSSVPAEDPLKLVECEVAGRCGGDGWGEMEGCTWVCVCVCVWVCVCGGGGGGFKISLV